MKRLFYFLSLIAGLLIILISIYGFFCLRQRPGLPQRISEKKIIQIDEIKIEKEKDFDFILSQKSIGEPSTVYLKDNGKINKLQVVILPYYSQVPFPLIYFLIGVFCFIIGVVVFLLRPEETRARIFYWASLAFASSVIISGEYYCLKKVWLSFLPGVIFCILYALAPALLLHFSLSFYRSKLRLSKYLIYGPALLWAGFNLFYFLYSSLKPSLKTYRFYQSLYYFFRIYIVLFVFMAIIYLIISYKKSLLEEEIAQIKWVFYGLFVGLGPFILVYQLPLVMKLKALISEEFSAVFFVIIPLAFAFSIIKFNLMNIELIINRSLVYAFLTVFTVSLYLFSIQIFQNLFSKLFVVQKTFVSGAGALLAAAAFHPARKKIQELVDRTFFRQSYDYREYVLHFSDKAHRMADTDHLIDFFLIRVKEALPLDYLGLSLYSLVPEKYELLVVRDGEKDLSSLFLLGLGSEKIFARKRAVRTLENMDFSLEKFLEGKKLEMIIPLAFKSTALAGFLALGKKKSGERFSREDLELLLTMAGELAVNLERIRLQEEVIYERASKEKSDELNKLKTEFISTVSHELRTPMSSLQGLTEILQAGKIRDHAKRGELLDLMASETGRLSRLLHNILDFGRIERQVKQYNFQNTEIRPIIEEVAKLFRHRLETDGFQLKMHFPEEPVILRIDPDALKQALTNLMDNAIKFSAGKKAIEIRLIESEREVEVQVKDFGVGIPVEEQEKIFEKFYRGTTSQHCVEGVGLGLKIAKHIMEAHKGAVRVQSQVNKGSTFKLIFPKT
jgi:signal transduction histidine kinase